jgi:alkanesulfonate monooxygenase SsuD/methylene tetrahydromethanopterin reductase-like flavin-dependent oxidoreductase (luciferase family)
MRTPSSFQYALDNHYNILMGNPYSANPGVAEALATYNQLKTEISQLEAVDIWALAHCFVHKDDDMAVEIPRVSWESAINSLVTYGTPRRADGTISKDYASHRDFGEEFANRPKTDPRNKYAMIVGDPKRCRTQIAELQAAGVPNLILWFNNGGGIPQAEVLKSMELFAAEVMPEFAD